MSRASHSKSKLKAFLLGLFFPGTGHLFLGRSRLGRAWGILFVSAAWLQYLCFLFLPPKAASPFSLAMDAVLWCSFIASPLHAAWCAPLGKSARARRYLPWCVAGWVVLLAGTSLLQRYVASFAIVPGESMAPTLLPGDHVVIDHRIGPDLLSRGQIVAYRSLTSPRVTLIERVAGLAGDQVEIRSGRLLVNGAPFGERIYRADLRPTTVAPSTVTLLDDNGMPAWREIPIQSVTGVVTSVRLNLRSLTRFDMEPK